MSQGPNPSQIYEEILLEAITPELKYSATPNQELAHLIGKRIKLIGMKDDPHPVEPGTLGTIVNVGMDVIQVKWDNGRTLGVVMKVDDYEIL